MSILEFLNKCTSVLQPVLGYSAAIFLIVVMWSYVNREDYEDDADTVTITFRCAQVLANQEQYPEIVISECNKLRDEK